MLIVNSIPNVSLQFCIDKEEPEQKDTAKYLGAYFDNNLIIYLFIYFIYLYYKLIIF